MAEVVMQFAIPPSVESEAAMYSGVSAIGFAAIVRRSDKVIVGKVRDFAIQMGMILLQVEVSDQNLVDNYHSEDIDNHYIFLDPVSCTLRPCN